MKLARRIIILIAPFVAVPACLSEQPPPPVSETSAATLGDLTTDADGDGVPAAEDCDDNNAAVGTILYYNDFSSDTHYFHLGKNKRPWSTHNGVVSNLKGGQSEYLGQDQVWTDTVTYAKVSAHGAQKDCSGCTGDQTTDRFRTGIVARMSVNNIQSEGFQGYRCAIATNAGADCHDPGNFVQLSAFLDSDIEDVNSECTNNCPPNNSFDQLARTERSDAIDLLHGDGALLTLWAVGNSLVCEVDGNGEHTVASALDTNFASGGIALSTLDALSDYDWVKVCAAKTTPATDEDHDGVPSNLDCNDHDAKVGKLLYENTFSSDTGYFEQSPSLTGPWEYGAGHVGNKRGGQQAYLGDDEAWTNTVTYVTLSGHGAVNTCNGPCAGDTTRFRAGVLARMTHDPDQGEGFHGYRCAIAENKEGDCHTSGPFVQLAAFLHAPEDDVNSECTVGCTVDPTFTQLARVARDEETDFLNGDSVALTFWAVGDKLVCDMRDENGKHFVAKAHDQHFASGGPGLSTLNALGEYDKVRVCEAFKAP